MPSDCAAVLKQPPKTCDVTSFASCLAHQLVFLIIFFCAENKHVCLCDLLSVRCLYDKIASSHQTFPSILLCTACIIHRKCNLKKNTHAFIPLNWFFLLKILVLQQLWLLLLNRTLCYVYELEMSNDLRKNKQIFQRHAHCSLLIYMNASACASASLETVFIAHFPSFDVNAQMPIEIP